MNFQNEVMITARYYELTRKDHELRQHSVWHREENNYVLNEWPSATVKATFAFIQNHDFRNVFLKYCSVFLSNI